MLAEHISSYIDICIYVSRFPLNYDEECLAHFARSPIHLVALFKEAVFRFIAITINNITKITAPRNVMVINNIESK